MCTWYFQHIHLNRSRKSIWQNRTTLQWTRLREEEKKERKIVNSNENHHICVGVRKNETQKQCRMVEKSIEVLWRRVRLT
jgi:hypothetical protein